MTKSVRVFIQSLIRGSPSEGLQFLDRIGRAILMEHAVAVCAYRCKICRRVDDMIGACVRELLEMVDLDESLADGSVGFFEVEPAHCAYISF